jgi:hypothetical protein
MEGLKPNLDVFDDPRFSEWRRGDDCSMSKDGHPSPYGCNGLWDYILALFSW